MIINNSINTHHQLQNLFNIQILIQFSHEYLKVTHNKTGLVIIFDGKLST